MKSKLFIAFVLLLCCRAHAQDTAFTYQGRLTEDGEPANGPYLLRFALYDAETNGNTFGDTITTPEVLVTNGVFTVMLDFGSGAFSGNRWLQISVRSNGQPAYTTLSPRQPITPAPHAIMANSAGSLLGSLPAAQLSGPLPSPQLAGTYSNAITFRNASGTFTGDGAGLTNVGGVWRLNGNNVVPGQFLGTTNDQPLELWAGGYPVWRVEPDWGGSFAGNLIGGYTNNRIEFPSGGNVIAGGGWAGGINVIRSNSRGNFIGAGSTNRIGPNVNDSVIAGGNDNSIGSFFAAIGGGHRNVAGGQYATVPGGQQNSALGEHSFAAGRQARAEHAGSFVWADSSSGTSFASSNANEFAVRAHGGVRIVTGGAGVTVDSMPLLSSSKEVVVPNSSNFSNIVNVVHGSSVNFVTNGVVGATISGGGAGYYFNGAFSNSVLGYFGTVGGGLGNRSGSPAAWYATVGGGSDNTASGNNSTVGGGSQNLATNWSTTVAGGVGNRANGSQATVGGGAGNQASGHSATVPGGQGNWAAGAHSFAAGYRANANHQGAFVWGDSTEATVASTAPNQFLIRAAGGVGIGTASPGATLDVRTTSNTGNAIRFGYYTGGEGNLIAGPSRVGIATGDMVERISIPQGTGNVGLGTLSPSAKLHVIGNILASGAITPNSDVHAKTNFAPVNVAEILEKVTRLSIQQWRFHTEAEQVKHVGPMAQDFRAAFGLGEIPTAIATVDADGVALAAIQGLHQKLEEKTTEIAELKRELAAIKTLVHQLANAQQ